MEPKYPIGTVLYKRFPDVGPDAFDVFVMTHYGWVATDQYGVQTGQFPQFDAETDNITPKVSEA
ncbi:hypothetical protein AVU99_gp121 [Mycobacterium phage Lolly9]|uniref:Uncharacterized protein n=1 Tax=Mycobacterium phage Lolly9 TaxID=1698711 RepID=A0A0K2FMZ4_9CAUD|nr:hypothetical protein AVU99_gp121 [Mycobacterium phage Lolly9]ALA48476.1 hypothetical protein LOLLY9_59 [Mycobacterium phage Lolly9]QOP65787.1 hypothetical protein PBI_MINILON_63 [Mycobacterium phage MiniLon]QOP66534.1 hypothetical protein PBI_MINIMAC_63 [Mycobacterium phage MiniMac]